jgi:uncharacterized membrane protein
MQALLDTLEKWGASLMRAAFYALMCVGLWFMLEASASYLEFGEAHPFFLEKLPLHHPTLWWTALYVHVPSALFALPACLVLPVRRVSARWPRLHRWLGRVTGAVVLGALVPSGMYLALSAQGGLVTTLGFWLTGLITFVAMLKSIQTARARNMKAHRRFSTHVAAQLAVAVISRFMLVGAESIGLYHAWVYIAALWIPVLGCVLAAELITGRRLSSMSKGSRHEELRPVPQPHPHAPR